MAKILAKRIEADAYYDKANLDRQRKDYNESCRDELFKAQLSNFLWNMPTIQSCNYPGIIGFDQLFKGKPAVVVGAGPSLDKNAHLLKKYRSKIIIVACDAALPVLIKKYDVYPHFVVMVDPTPKQKKNFFIDGKPIDTTRFYTIVPPVVHPSIFRTIDPSHLAVYNLKDDKNAIFERAPYHIGRRGALPAAILSSGACFCFAAAMWCDPIIFIGQDLSWASTEKVYADGISDWKVDYQKGAKFKGNCMLFPDIHGKLVLTHQTLVMFWAWLRDNTKFMENKIVNSSEGGILKFKGIKIKTLQKSIDMWCKKELVGVEEMINKAYNDRHKDGKVEVLMLPKFKPEHGALYKMMTGKEVR